MHVLRLGDEAPWREPNDELPLRGGVREAVSRVLDRQAARSGERNRRKRHPCLLHRAVARRSGRVPRGGARSRWGGRGCSRAEARLRSRVLRMFSARPGRKQGRGRDRSRVPPDEAASTRLQRQRAGRLRGVQSGPVCAEPDAVRRARRRASIRHQPSIAPASTSRRRRRR